MNELDTIFDDDNLPADHRSGVIAVAGRPNVGKSTLINAILGQKIAIVSPRPQTTQRQQLGIYTVPQAQALFVDTPGLHAPRHKLGEYMVTMAENALRDADVILWVLDGSVPPQPAETHIAETIKRVAQRTPVVLVLNKSDLPLDDATRAAHQAAYEALVPHVAVWQVSALDGTNVAAVTEDVLGRLPHGPRYYPVDQLSEVNMRFIAAEVIREKIMLHTEQEIPHAVAIEVDRYEERADNLHYISAIIYVERDSQKGIIIGKGGAMIKRIGTQAREELAAMLDASIYIDLRVKVLKNWRGDERLMARLGYRLPKDDDR